MNPTHSYAPKPLSRPARSQAGWLTLWLCILCALVTAFAPAARAQSTNFLSNNGAVLADIDDYYYRAFTLNRTTTFDLRFTPDYNADCVILAPNNLNAFIGGYSYRYFEGFDNRMGTQRFTLAPGNYYLAIRNEVNARNTFSVELDYALTALAPDSNGTYSFSRWGISGARYVPARGGILYHAFSTTSTERALLDGCNSGLETYIVSSNQINNVVNGRSFTYYSAYSGNGTDLPGMWDVTLPVGNYYLVFINRSNIPRAVTYQMEYWKRVSNPLYLDLQGPASWSFSGNTVNIDVAKIINTSSTITSGSLRLSLWALNAPYNGTSNSGVNMANLDLKPLLPRYQYTNLRYNLPVVRPSGSYYTAFLLNEWTGSQWRVVDWINMSNISTFDTRTTRGVKVPETSNLVASGAPRPNASISASPLPATRSTAAISTRSATGVVGTSTANNTIAAPPTTNGVLSSANRVGQGRSKATPRSTSPNPSAGAS